MTGVANQFAVAGAVSCSRGGSRNVPNDVPQADLNAALANLLILLNFATPGSKHSETSGDYAGYGSRTWAGEWNIALAWFSWAVGFAALVSIVNVFATNSDKCPLNCPGWFILEVLSASFTGLYGCLGISLISIKDPAEPGCILEKFADAWDALDALASGEEGLSLTDDGIIIGPSDKLSSQFLEKLVTKRKAHGLPVPQIFAAVLAWFQLIQTESVLSADGHPILSRESLAPFLPEVRKAEIAMMRKAEIARMRALKGPGEEGERELRMPLLIEQCKPGAANLFLTI